MGGDARALTNVVTQPSDVALFLGSSQGALLYQDWASGLVNDARVVCMAGALVLETQRVFLAAVQ